MKIIKFNLKDGSVREFSSDSQGEGFAQEAATFEADNKAEISLRTDSEVTETLEAPAPEEVPVEPTPEEPAPETPVAEQAPEAPVDTAPENVPAEEVPPAPEA